MEPQYSHMVLFMFISIEQKQSLQISLKYDFGHLWGRIIGNSFLGMFRFHTPTPPPPSLRNAKIGVIFFIILGCSLNELVTKGASGKFFFQGTRSKN